MTLREFRQANKLSQRELAQGLTDALGRTIRHQYIGKWERSGNVPDDVAAALGLEQELPLAGDASPPDPDDASRVDRERPPQPPSSGAVRGGDILPSPRQLRDRIEKFYVVIGEAVMMADPHDGLIITNLAPQAAEAWVEVCAEHPFVARVWNYITLGGAWGGLAWVHAPAVVMVLAHHNLLPELRLFPDAATTHGQTGSPADGAEAPVGAAPAPPAG